MCPEKSMFERGDCVYKIMVIDNTLIRIIFSFYFFIIKIDFTRLFVEQWPVQRGQLPGGFRHPPMASTPAWVSERRKIGANYGAFVQQKRIHGRVAGICRTGPNQAQSLGKRIYNMQI